MTYPLRTRTAQGSRGTHRARRTRSHALALLLVVAGALLGWTLPLWERQLPAAGLTFDASTAQATLAAIAGGMITLAGFVVTAITLVVQTVQAMSPRLVAALGHFSRYLVLFGLLIGTALYALVALSQIRGENVPRLTVTLAVGLVLVDAVTVLSLLASLRHAVTGGGLARAVGARLRTVIDEVYPPEAGTHPPPTGGRGPAPESHALPPEVPVVYGGRPSVIFALEEPQLIRLAARHNVRVRFVHAVGAFVGTGTTVASVEPSKALPTDASTGTGNGTNTGTNTARHGRLTRQVTAHIRFGPSRTVEQDPAYGFRLLADIAIRALSPAVNDPTTAVQALDQIEDVLLRLANRPLGPAWLLDKHGRPRIHSPAPEWPDLVSLALDETLLYGSANPQIVRRLHALFDRLLAATTDDRGDRRAPITERRQALERLAATCLPDPLLRSVATQPDPHGLGGVRLHGARAREERNTKREP
ncbi:DUF2254 domain-containing protein [Streptomyces sp. NPDC047117]|uniref:DUF2254 domain-containing protein n=1 Tax=Streptomyces sp. NPDC047117 TaxID=3155379 RepID=UPI0033F09A40